MKLQYLISTLFTVVYVSATAIDLGALDNVIIARNPQCRPLKREPDHGHDHPPDGKKHSTTTPCTTKTHKPSTTCKETTHATTARTTMTTKATTTSKATTATTTKMTTTTTMITTTLKVTTTTSSTCGTESAQCDPVGTNLPPCCSGSCIIGFDAAFCRTSCLADGSPCLLDHPEVCCGQVCLTAGYCVTVD